MDDDEVSRSSGQTSGENGLVCIEYPGVIKNTDKMIETLGGLSNIAQVVSEPNRRLELRFRPDDIYCKPTCGERHLCTSFLLRVKRKKRKAGVDPSKPEYKHTTSLHGSVSICYKFTNLCDFQYLPMETPAPTNGGNDADGKSDAAHGNPVSIYDKVYFKKLVSSDWVEKSAPLFIPPAVFSRMDVPQDYQFRREAASDKTADTPHNIIGRTRQRRSHHAIFVTYDVARVPEKPRDIALNQIKLKFIDQDRLKQVKDKFRERPVWTKNALHALTKIAPDRLKFILPALGYYFTNGPWRNQWVRLGYDPRKKPEAGQYQTLDYRVRLKGGARHKVAAKRSYANYLLPYKATNFSKPRTSLINKNIIPDANEAKPGDSDSGEEADKYLDILLFREGRIPPYRQMFYQYCDIQVPACQEILVASRSQECTEKSGWYVAGTEDKIRMEMTRVINSHISAQRFLEVELDSEEKGDLTENLTGSDSGSEIDTE